jgi:hypothetical protein
VTQLPMFGQPPSEPEIKPADDRVVQLRLLVTVKAAPNPSDKYGETVCVAGLSVDPFRPGWVRLYPINFRELGDDASFAKYDIISVNAVPARQDARRESWRPQMHTLRCEGHFKDWRHRRPWLDPAITADITMCRLHRGATMNSPYVERDLASRSAHLPEELPLEFPAGRCVVKAAEATLERDEFPVEKPLLVSTAFGNQAKHPRTFSVLGVYWPKR